MTLLLNLSKDFKIPFFIDPKPQNIDYYKGATIITPNQHEAEIISGITINDKDTLFQASQKIVKKLEIEAVLITRGAEGMSLFKDNKIWSIPTMAKEVYDVTGAGDTSIASFALAYVSGLDFLSSVMLSNICAGIVVSKLGTGAVKINELLKELNEMDLSNFFIKGYGKNE
jgi:D-beta-D-heptose 7-phosphate kinase/D-beta-D-heptose 1-phosphate adenosyltransferase